MLNVETAMEKINDIINSEVTMSEENDSLESSMKADIEESMIFEDSEAEMGDFFINSDEKTDNEVTKNHGQVRGKQEGFQEKLKTHLTEEQKRMSKKALTLRTPQLNNKKNKNPV